MLQRGLVTTRAPRAPTTPHGIGGVGRHQERRTIAAPHRALETPGNFDAEQDLARQEEIVELVDAVDLAGDWEIGGVFSAPSGSSGRDRCPLQQDRRRQMARRGVDGVAEQTTASPGIITIIANDTRVSPELNETPDHHCVERRQKPNGGSRTSLRSAWMTISLIEIVLGPAHQFDEHVFQRWREYCQCNPGLSRQGAIRRLERRLVTAGDVQAGAERATMSTPGLPVRSSETRCRSRRSPCRSSARISRTPRHGAMRQRWP